MCDVVNGACGFIFSVSIFDETKSMFKGNGLAHRASPNMTWPSLYMTIFVPVLQWTGHGLGKWLRQYWYVHAVVPVRVF